MHITWIKNLNCSRLNTCTKGNIAISPHDYVRSGEYSEKVSCSVGSVWVEVWAAFDKSGDSKVWGRARGWGIKLEIFGGHGFSVKSRKIARKVFFLQSGLPWTRGHSLQEKIVRREAKRMHAWWLSVIFIEGVERFLEQQWDGSGGETTRGYFVVISLINYHIFFQCIT